jgi:hypothetical protein
VARVDVQQVAAALDKGAATPVPGQVAEVPPGDRAYGARQHDQADVKVPGAGVGGHRQQRQRAGKWDAGVLDQDAKGSGRVPQGLRDRPNIQMHQLFL